MPESAVLPNRLSEIKYEVMDLLVSTYLALKKLNEAHALLAERIALESRYPSKDNQSMLGSTMDLAVILSLKSAHSEALLYGRRALKGYRKLGLKGRVGVESSLKILCEMCRAAGNQAEEDAYQAMLADLMHQRKQGATLSTPDIPTRPGSRLKISPEELADELEWKEVIARIRMQDIGPESEKQVLLTASEMGTGPRSRTFSGYPAVMYAKPRYNESDVHFQAGTFESPPTTSEDRRRHMRHGSLQQFMEADAVTTPFGEIWNRQERQARNKETRKTKLTRWILGIRD
ncbi:hypothetical protein BDZ45DRAFT_682219 [Acephala macrosclerotiorum]|nr:hypothetical protein BDZ45DRAFT_682219 [Acephala macrosclerotiorum]